MDKVKNFISIIPLNDEKNLSKVKYLADEGSPLNVNIETRFPIMVTIAAYANPGEKIKVTYILTEHSSSKYNFENLFMPELNELKTSMNLEIKEVEILTPYNQYTETKLGLFADIIEKLEDNEELYACMTYGNKPTTQTLPMALNYAYRTKENVSVECIVYGEKDFATEVVRIYDTTSMFYMNEIVNNLAEEKAKNPLKIIKTLLDIGDCDE